MVASPLATAGAVARATAAVTIAGTASRTDVMLARRCRCDCRRADVLGAVSLGRSDAPAGPPRGRICLDRPVRSAALAARDGAAPHEAGRARRELGVECALVAPEGRPAGTGRAGGGDDDV